MRLQSQQLPKRPKNEHPFLGNPPAHPHPNPMSVVIMDGLGGDWDPVLSIAPPLDLSRLCLAILQRGGLFFSPA